MIWNFDLLFRNWFLTLESNNLTLTSVLKQFSISYFNSYWNSKLVILWRFNQNLLIYWKLGANIDNAIDWKPLKCYVLRSQYFLCKKVEAFDLIVRHKIWHLFQLWNWTLNILIDVSLISQKYLQSSLVLFYLLLFFSFYTLEKKYIFGRMLTLICRFQWLLH